MSILFRPRILARACAEHDAAAARLHAYAERQTSLGARRLLFFAVALVLLAFYVGSEYVAVSTILIIISEAFDGRTSRQARNLRDDNRPSIRIVLRRIHMGVLYSSLMISFFALSIAFAASGGNSFIATLYILAAAVFTATNAHQLLSALVIQLFFYGMTALAIPFADVLSSEGLSDQNAWLVFFTSLFAFYFVVDASNMYRRYDRDNRCQLAQLRSEKARAVRALDDTAHALSIVRNEVRAPLTSIRTSLGMASASGPLPKVAMQALTTAQRNTARLATQVDELLDSHAFKIDEMTFDFRDVQLARLVAAAVTNARSSARAHGSTLKMLPVDTDIIVRADPRQLEQMITELLYHAVSLSTRGSEVSMCVAATPEHVRINISDQGEEMDTAYRTPEFTISRQLQSVAPRPKEGKSSRLAVYKQIIEAHGGLLGMDYRKRGGIEFYVQLIRVLPSSPAPT